MRRDVTNDTFNKEKLLKFLSEQSEMVHAVSVSADHLRELVNTVLTVSSIERKTLTEHQAFDPKLIIRKVKSKYSPQL